MTHIYPTFPFDPNSFGNPDPNPLQSVPAQQHPRVIGAPLQVKTGGTIISTSMDIPSFKPKRVAKAKSSHVIFVLDESSSMGDCYAQTIRGFNEFLDGQKLDSEKTNTPVDVSLYKFNGNSVINTFGRKNIKTVEPLSYINYKPNGGTNLLDAIGHALVEVNEGLAAKKKSERESVIFVILTDGEENTSRRYSNATIRGMVKACEDKGWLFMFLGANIDAFLVGSTLGFGKANTVAFTNASAGNAMTMASQKVSHYRSASLGGMDPKAVYDKEGFTDDERKKALDTTP